MNFASNIKDEYIPGQEAPPKEEAGGSDSLTIRTPNEILDMQFDDSDKIAGDRIVARGQSATLLGAGGIGKSRIAEMLAVAQITQKRFLALDTYGVPLNWLFLQAENSNRRLQADLRALKNWAGDLWPEVDKHIRFHTIEKDHDGFLNLDNKENQKRITCEIQTHNADVVVFDPLNCFAIGDPNKDSDMRETCQAISWIVRQGKPERTPFVLHHALTGKAGASKATGFDRASFGRNSKVLQAWTRGQINVAPGSSEDNDTLVISCGKCSNGREFEPFAVKLNQATMLYEVDSHFDVGGWESEVSGKKEAGPSITVELVADLCRGTMPKAELVKAIRAETGCSISMAYKQIGKAEQRKLIHRNPVTKEYVKR